MKMLSRKRPLPPIEMSMRRSPEAICPSQRPELIALIRIHYLGRTKPDDGLVQRLGSEIDF
jgi:hypothetical protein